MKRSFQESLWLPAAVLVIGALLVLGLLATASRASMPSPQAGYPTPSLCLFLPMVDRFSSNGAQSAAAGMPSQAAPESLGSSQAYPQPGICDAQKKNLIYIPIVYR
jgi:hypothetical protein